jgi:hypothetical protein
MDYTALSRKENAARISAGEAFFHSFIDLPGNTSANLSAKGQETFRLPDNVRLIVGWLNPRCFAMSVCVIMVVIISYNLQCVKPFIAIYNDLLQLSEIIANYSLVFVIKGGVW